MKVSSMFPSPHSGILFLFILQDVWVYAPCRCFRPLIRGFFFYKAAVILEESAEEHERSFRPLIRGFFFYPVVMICRQV